MKTTLRKIGNSRGVLIPAAFLTAYKINTEIEMRQEGQRIIIEPVKTVRCRWFNGYQAENDTESWAGLTETTTETEDWQW